MDRFCDQHGVSIESLQLAFCFGGHPRLGEQSPICGLDRELCQAIAEQAAVFHVSQHPASALEFKSVGEAIRSTPDGCTICIAPGEYEEEKPICITARVTLIGSPAKAETKEKPKHGDHGTHAGAEVEHALVGGAHGHDWTEEVAEGPGGEEELMSPTAAELAGEGGFYAAPEAEENAVTLKIRSERKALVMVNGARARVRLHRLTLLHRSARAEAAQAPDGPRAAAGQSEDEDMDGGEVGGLGVAQGGGGARRRGRRQRRGAEEQLETERPRCIDVLQGALSLYSCVVRSEEGNGLTVRGSGKAMLFNCQVSLCGLHGVSAMHGALVEAEACRVASNRLSGFNAIGKGACVRCIDCTVHENEDGGVNVVEGALALTSLTSINANRGTGVRALGEGSWAVQADCVVARNGWHGVSALEGGQMVIERSKMLRNRGAGVNAFSAGRASVVGCLVSDNRYGVWAQNNGLVRIEDSSTGPSLQGDETALAGGRIVRRMDSEESRAMAEAAGEPEGSG